MSDKEKNLNAEETQFEGREVKNSTPQLDEEEYNQIQEKAKSLRAETDDDFPEEEESIEEDNDIINSLLESAKDDAPVQDTIKDVKSKFSFLQKKEKNDDKSSEGDKKLSFFKKKNKKEQEKIPEETEEPETTEEIENSEDIEEPINEDSAHKEKKKHKSGGLFLKKNKGSELNDFLSNDSEDDSANADDINTVEEIERNARLLGAKKKTNKLKPLFIGLGALLGIIIVGSLVMSLIGNKKPVEQPPENKPVIEEPTDDDFESIENKDTLYKQGKIKRILGNKVLIIPDGETENTIYYVDSMDVIENYKAGAHIEYGYVIRNYLPYITEIIEIKEGEVIYKGIMTINIMVNDSLVKFSYDDSVENDIKDIATGDIIQYVYEMRDNNPTITNIINIKKSNEKTDDIDEEAGENPNKNPITEDLFNGYVYKASDFYDEYTLIDSRGDEETTRVTTKTNIENNSISFYNGLTGPIWIRHAWRSTDIIEKVPSIDAIDIVLVLPDGTRVDNSNIDQYGRMWMDGNIINYAIKEPQIGEYQLIDNKPNGSFLGEASIHLMELSGFISIDKFGANLVDRDTLELVWNIGGVPDDGLEIEVYLTNDRFSTMVYSGSSKNEILHTVDKRTVSVSNLPRGRYNVIVKVKDLDMKTQADDPEIPENTIQITAETIIDTKNVGVLLLQ